MILVKCLQSLTFIEAKYFRECRSWVTGGIPMNPEGRLLEWKYLRLTRKWSGPAHSPPALGQLPPSLPGACPLRCISGSSPQTLEHLQRPPSGSFRVWCGQRMIHLRSSNGCVVSVAQSPARERRGWWETCLSVELVSVGRDMISSRANPIIYTLKK